MFKILDASFETIPEEIYSIAKRFLEETDWVVYDLEDLHLEVLPELKREIIHLSNGTKTEIKTPSNRPENLAIIFFGKKIGLIKIRPYRLNSIGSRLEIISYISPETDSIPTALDSETQAWRIMNLLADKIKSNLKISEIKDAQIDNQRESKYQRIAPMREADKNKWEVVWKKIKIWAIDEAMQPDMMVDKLKQSHPKGYNGPIPCKETIRKIIKAGKKGELNSEV